MSTHCTWPEISFGEIFDISSSKRVLERQWKQSGVPFYRAREIVKLARDGYVDNDLFISEDLYDEMGKRFGVPKPGDLMVSAVGTLGACYQVQPTDRFYYKDASVLLFHPRQKICSRFFEHAFAHHAIKSQVEAGSGSTVGTLTISRANELRIKLPPFSEQRRIAAILDKADALRRKRKRAIELLDSLAQSIFLGMFGDVRVSISVADVCSKVTDGTHQSPKWATQGVPFLFVSNVRGQNINYETNKFVSYAEFENLTRRTPIEKGDVLYTAVGSYGNAAVVDGETDFVFQRHIAHLKTKSEYIVSTYLSHALESPVVMRQADALARGIAQKTVTLDSLKKFQIPLPPIEEQRRFERMVLTVKKQADRAHMANLHLEKLFSSLRHRAFSGHL
ncbi:restriction endonuclease subunit S [Mesorhizobium sp. LHD-90]|uniref:restriction endonuclease subunit S n=1 Tax=Mesorhizobium sp. LHD-90 TaxID=3071414 RepID=UPI0027E17344|nr:restriction endonuclease subunit S [Mesorhizobium sp. LHD-90]MDQ6434350.1 restriction endonuclease subunit S [Mesorhizobium sp. LHD-90]